MEMDVKPKTIVTGVLLLLVAASIGFLALQETGASVDGAGAGGAAGVAGQDDVPKDSWASPMEAPRASAWTTTCFTWSMRTISTGPAASSTRATSRTRTHPSGTQVTGWAMRSKRLRRDASGTMTRTG